jgi:hypothetical protein
MNSKEYEAALEAGESYLRACMSAIREIEGLPMMLVALTKRGPLVVIGASFPDGALPSREEWAALYPGDRQDRSIRVAVKLGDVIGH